MLNILPRGYRTLACEQRDTNLIDRASLKWSMRGACSRSLQVLRITALLLIGTITVFGVGDENVNAQNLGGQYIPSDAIVVGEVKVAETLAAPAAEMYPIEIFDALSKQNLGVGVESLQKVRFVVAAPGPGEPQFAVMLFSSMPLQIEKLSGELVDLESPSEIGGHECYPIVDAPGVVLHQANPKTLVIASQGYLNAVLRAGEPSSRRGALAELANDTPVSGNATILAAVTPIRPMAMGMVQAMAAQIPPPLQPFTQIPALLDAVVIGMDLEEADLKIQFDMLTSDEAKATQLNGLITNGLQFGRQMMMSQMMSGMDADDPMADATRRYMERLSGMFITSMTPVQDGSKLSMDVSPTQGMAVQGVLVGLLLPAVQAARESARRMSSMNNLKQVGLAMHNSHSVYRKFPGDILSDDGTPLLSWRVAILPFIEQQTLYEQFKLDEPWDSPHNIQLLEKMPPVFNHPGVVVKSGQTVYQKPIGPKFIFEGHEGTSMRYILDGTSNTIMVLETPEEAAVEWTKPSDLDVDLDDLTSSVIGWDRQGFNALIADGSVRYISAVIDLEILKALLTRDGGEIIDSF